MIRVERDPLNSPLLRTAIILFVIFYFFYATNIQTFVSSIDDEYPPFIGYDFWRSSGRWSMYFLTYVVPNTSLPFLPYILFGFFSVFAYLVFLRALGVDTFSLLHYLIFPVFIAFPTWAFLAEFRNNMPGTGLGLLLAATAALLFRQLLVDVAVRSKLSHGSTLLHSALCIGASATAIGFYQSFVLVQATLYLSVLATLLCAGSLNMRKLALGLIAMAVLLALGVALYMLIARIVLLASGSELYYVQGFFNPEAFFNTPWRVAYQAYVQARDIYLGSSRAYGTQAYFVGLLLLLAALGVAGVVRTRGWAIGVLFAGFAIVILAIPFAINFVSGGTMPVRSLFAVPVAVTAVCLIGASYVPPNILRWSFVFFPLVYFHIVQVSSHFDANRVLARVHDHLLAGAIYERIAQTIPDMSQEKRYKIDIYGAKRFPGPFDRAPTSTGGHSFFEWDGGEVIRIRTYLRYIGFVNLALPRWEERRRAVPVFESMPAWPAKGAVKLLDDVILVKLGDVPSPTHPKALPATTQANSFGSALVAMDRGWEAGEKSSNWISGQDASARLAVQKPSRGSVEVLVEGEAKAQRNGASVGTLIVDFDAHELGRLDLSENMRRFRHRFIVPQNIFNTSRDHRLTFRLEDGNRPVRIESVALRDAEVLSEFDGHLDLCAADKLQGWAIADGLPVSVAVTVNGEAVEATVTNVARPDLAAADIPISAGFNLVPSAPIPAGSEVVVRYPNGAPLRGPTCTP